jgi:phosphoesterase RecJ-like protein
LSRLQEPGLVEYIGESVIILGHHNADPDAVGSAQGVKELIERLKPGTVTRIVMPDDISRLSMKLIEALELDVFEGSSMSFDTLVIVDSGGLNQLGAWESQVIGGAHVVILIDHHTLDERLSKHVDLLIHDDEASSTSEIVQRLYEKNQLTPSVTTSKALLAGIVFDSKYFTLGDSNTFKAASMLLENIGDISGIREIMQTEIDVSEKIARLKSGQRSEIHQINDWVIVFSELGSYQASGARALISIGADIAIVIGSEKDETRVSLRSTQAFYDKTGLHLGELVSAFSSANGGSGSGHPTAAGYNGAISPVILRQMLLKNITEQIK